MSDTNEIAEAVGLYMDMIYFGDLEKFDRVFHPESSLFGRDGDDISVLTTADYRNAIATREPPVKRNAPRKEEILLIDWLSPTSAVAKTRARIDNNIFVDHLSFVKDKDGFKIVSKTWTLQDTVDA